MIVWLSLVTTFVLFPAPLPIPRFGTEQEFVSLAVEEGTDGIASENFHRIGHGDASFNERLLGGIGIIIRDS
ncbi:MAG: hypothetical protein O3C43_13750 [Verrucomicrobia bacterium]|nr:hypothetical protein [Verrucomicrobiota bacterium]MDA1067556.1 hypothetical protein [Verrucomicrobiota bacterium]